MRVLVKRESAALSSVIAGTWNDETLTGSLNVRTSIVELMFKVKLVRIGAVVSGIKEEAA